MICLVSGASRTLQSYIHTGRFGQLINPRSGDHPVLGVPWACDNSAFADWNAERFVRMLDKVEPYLGCMWVAAPDVVADARQTLERFEVWEPALAARGFPVALVAQDGLQPGEVPWDRLRCLFIGGTTGYKLGGEARELIREAQRRGKLTHVGRVGTGRRIRYFQALGVDSIDGGVFSSHPEQAFTNFTSQLLNPQTGLEIA